MAMSWTTIEQKDGGGVKDERLAIMGPPRG